MLTIIDNYDSFTYNLVHFLGDLGVSCRVIRNDEKTVQEVLADAPPALILSPGPCTPSEAGICLELIREAPETLPILGVCLGHQAIGQAFGGTIIRAPKIMHGKLSHIYHNKKAIFADLKSPAYVTRYHSLIIARESLPACFDITAETKDNIIMGITHKTRPLYGVQFHPESIASAYGHAMLANFLKIADINITNAIPEIYLQKQDSIWKN